MSFNPIYCSDCGNDVKGLGEYHYKIKTEIWLKVANSSETLCIGCLEKRLKRALTFNDFTNESINRKNSFRRSARLLNILDKRTSLIRAERINKRFEVPCLH